MITQKDFAEGLRVLREKYGEQEVLDYLAISRGTFYNYLRNESVIRISWHLATLVKLALEGDYETLLDAEHYVKQSLDFRTIEITRQKMIEHGHLTRHNKELISRVNYLESHERLTKDLAKCHDKLNASNKKQEELLMLVSRMQKLIEETDSINKLVIDKMKER